MAERDGVIIFFVVLSIILNVFFALGPIFLEHLLSLSHYVFPTSYEGYGPYTTTYGDFRPAEDIVEFASLAADNNTKIQIVTSIIFGNIFDNYAGILFWLLQTEALRSIYIVVWLGFMSCIIIEYRAASISIVVMLIFGLIEVVRGILYIVAWTQYWWFVTSPGDNSTLTPQFITMFVIVWVTVGYIALSLIFMGIIVGRLATRKSNRRGVVYQTDIVSQIGTLIFGKRKKRKKKRKRRKKKRNFEYRRIPNKEH
jgi:hypothetical protein